MNKSKIDLVGIFLVLLCCLLTAMDASAAKLEPFAISPVTKNGEKWRIAYYQGGAYENYYHYLATTVRGLMELGWMERTALPASSDRDSRTLWGWLSNNAESKYLEFADDAFYSAAWDDSVREKLSNKVVTRLRDEADIDLVLAMGTWAGQDLANDRHSVPTIIITSNNPISSGAIKSAEDSGFDHINARVDPFANMRQIELFHEIAGFEKLGIAYEDSVAGRTYAAIDAVKAVAAERGFEVVECYTQSDIPDLGIAGRTVTNCFEELAIRVDAVYVTQQGGVNRDTIPRLVAITNEHRIPTLSNIGDEGVRYGFLLGISNFYGSEASGLFFASNMARVFNGAKPRALSQVMEESPRIAINLKTAEIVGLYLYADILAAADQVFQVIEKPE